MNKTFVLFRHGETEWNVKKLLQGHTDIPLNQNGLTQAKRLAEFLKYKELQMIYSSDLKRALHTGQVVAELSGVPIEQTEKLRESHMGEVEGKSFVEVMENFGEDIWNSYLSLEEQFLNRGFPGGETRGEALARIKGFIEQLALESPYQRIGISTHGGIMRNLLHSFLPDFSKPLSIPNCVSYELKFFADTQDWKISGPLR